MNYLKNVDELKKFLKIKDDRIGVTHYINNRSLLLPFTTTEPERAKFKRGFVGVIGELARALVNKELIEPINLKEFIVNLMDCVEIEEDDSAYLYKFLSEYLIEDQNTIKVVHPYLYQYVNPLESKESKGEKEVGIFARDVLLCNYNEFSEYFTDNKSKDVISKLVITNIPNLEDSIRETKYNKLIDFVGEVLRDDLEFLLKHKDFLMKNLPCIVSYYYFFYISQLTIKINKGSKANYNKVEELYYLLDWESINKSRSTLTKGYSFVKDEGKDLYLNINLLEHLNHIFGTKGAGFVELNNIYNNEENKEKILEALHKWIEIYRYNIGVESISNLENDYDKSVEVLKNSLNMGINKATRGRYYLSLEAIAKNGFVKKRGSYGYVLNIHQELLLLITAISIKDERIKLRDLFKEYEKRGIFLDRYSMEEVVELLDRLNLIEKKSDSGDGQYVKSIL